MHERTSPSAGRVDSSAAATTVATASLTFDVNLSLPAKHTGITGLSGQDRRRKKGHTVAQMKFLGSDLGEFCPPLTGVARSCLINNVGSKAAGESSFLRDRLLWSL